MRPLKLVMQAFGAYPDKVEIPFENLGEGNIYLIAGATGSGKTTIFDAICFSLFNTPCGINRTNDTLRSHYANDDIESFVEFTFLYRGEIYKIKRNPSYIRKKLKGEGDISQAQKATLILPDGKIINTAKEVDGYIEELLGLNASRFSQIALLAQGDFLKILNSDTQTRGEIFRILFNTSDYSLFQQRIKFQCDEKKNFYDKLTQSICSHLKETEIEKAELTELKTKICDSLSFELLDDLTNGLDKQNELDSIKISKIQDELNFINKNNVELEKQLDVIKTKNELIKQIDEINKILSKKRADFEIIKNDFNNLNEKKSKADELKSEIKKLDDDYKKSLQIKNMQDEINELEAQKERVFSIIKKNELKINELKYNHLCSLLYELNSLEEELNKNQNNFKEINENCNLKNNLYIQKYNAYLSAQAGILSLSLKDNFPCPVCGSLHHPTPAVLGEDSITKDELDNLKNEADICNNELSQTALKCSVLKETLKNKTDEFEKIKTLYVTNKNIVPVKESVNFELKIKELSDSNIKNKKNSDNLILDITKLQSSLDILKKDIKCLDSISEQYEKLSTSLKELSCEIEKTQNLYHSEDIEINKLAVRLEMLKNQIEKYKDVNTDEKALSQSISDNKNIISKFNLELENLLSRKTFNEKKVKMIKNEFIQYKKAKDTYMEYKLLSDCASGLLKGKAKIAFEQYIQGYYLDLVLFEANKRLSLMTKNQFRLYRKKDVTSKASKTGLDIEVMDFHTGKKRNTKTLSGGESFMAALALALGLSDCISSLTNTSDIAAMFIDEGFGSLDTEALELALDTIVSLASTNRLVGIISHVDELKNKIQNRIITHKTNNGSFIEINF